MSRSKRFEEYAKRFKENTDQEMVELFNGEVGKHGWGSSRASYIAALHHEFERRKFDFSLVGSPARLSFKSKVKLDGKKIMYASSPPEKTHGPNAIIVSNYLKNKQTK